MDELNKIKTWTSFLASASIGLSLLSSVAIADSNVSNSASTLSINYLNYASNKEFVFSPKSLRWKAINSNGKVIRTGRASGGRGYCPDVKRSCRTPTGSYRVIGKRGASCRSSRYPVGKGGAPMPYCMFFSKYYAIHGSSDVPNRNASHGCIRVLPSDARWLHQNFIDVGTKVVVKPY